MTLMTDPMTDALSMGDAEPQPDPPPGALPSVTEPRAVEVAIPQPPPEAPLEHHVRLYRGALAPEWCREIIRRFEADPNTYTGKTLGGYRPDVKETTDLGISHRKHQDPDVWLEPDRAIWMAVDQTFGHYKGTVPGMNGIVGSMGDTGYQMQRYLKGRGYFRTHIDAADTRTCGRLLACVLFLNTVEEGGELCFPAQGLKVKPEEGALVWFPAGFTHPHEGAVPLSGPKYVVSSFLCWSEHVDYQMAGDLTRPAPEHQGGSPGA